MWWIFKGWPPLFATFWSSSERAFRFITSIVRIYYSRKNMKGQDVLPLGPALWAARNLLVCEAFERIGHSYELVWSIILIRNWYKARLRKFRIKWRWKGKVFVAFKRVSLSSGYDWWRCRDLLSDFSQS